MTLRRFIYTLAVLALLPWAAIHLLWRARRQKEYLHHWGERWGFFPQRKPSQQYLAPTIWLHAVSVGETRAAQPLVAALCARYPDHRVLFTHMTPTGRAASVALFGDTVERLYLPYDTPWAMRRFLCHYQPRIGLIMETELWPNLLTECRAAGVPVYLLNARLSARSARRYGRWPNLTRQVLQSLSAIGAQSADDAARLTRLGAEKITVTGNIKFDIATPPEQMELGRVFRARMGARPVWLAASTREGEEALILDAWHSAMNSKKVLSPLPGGAGDTAMNSQNKAVSPLLVIVPRHPQRFDEVARLVTDRGLRLQRRSEESAIAPTTHVLLGDSMGEMFAWYAAVDVAFIGGSLKDYGCQNLIEACAVGTPVLIGPSTYNFAEAAREALACGAAHAITDADDLVRQMDMLLTDVAYREQMSRAGREFAARHRGATAHTLELISSSISSTVR
ncbi:MAG: 3-deoxy-D-manno-octulosonic acid transferase [Rugosibacter sp.]|nr:MAG: 3-deoxy-D-manno-octulosonic acid transferase [Rugosibacter sp.]TBR07068.1 MAG: 3-deoxy-D-manno-octulosonic acid transferase [Rugosibacter sp.]